MNTKSARDTQKPDRHKATDAKALLGKHPQLTQSDNQKVISHVQREDQGWYLNTLMIEGCDVPFKYRRQKLYKNLKGQRVNLSYYPDTERVAGLEFEILKVVRIRVS